MAGAVHISAVESFQVVRDLERCADGRELRVARDYASVVRTRRREAVVFVSAAAFQVDPAAGAHVARVGERGTVRRVAAAALAHREDVLRDGRAVVVRLAPLDPDATVGDPDDRDAGRRRSELGRRALLGRPRRTRIVDPVGAGVVRLHAEEGVGDAVVGRVVRVRAGEHVRL